MTPPGFEPVRGALKGRRILVAEYDRATASRLSGMLESSGCNVVGPAATSGASVELLRDEEVDGAIVGLDLRDRAAHTVMDELSVRRIPFLLTSAVPAPPLPTKWRPYLMLEPPLMLAQVQTALARMLA